MESEDRNSGKEKSKKRISLNPQITSVLISG